MNGMKMNMTGIDGKRFIHDSTLGFGGGNPSGGYEITSKSFSSLDFYDSAGARGHGAYGTWAHAPWTGRYVDRETGHTLLKY